MAYVTVPKDLDKVKNKVVLNLTLRQIICIGAGGLIGVPFYFATKDAIGSTAAATGMVLVMLPAFFFAMYEKDGLSLEKILWNMWMVKHVRPKERRREDTGCPGASDGRKGKILRYAQNDRVRSVSGSAQDDRVRKASVGTQNSKEGGTDGKREAVSVAEDRKNIRTGKHPV